MKYISSFVALGVMAATMGGASAAYDSKKFRAEILEGVDVNVARVTVDVVDDAPAGALGSEIYSGRHTAADGDLGLYIPTTMYVRGGAGLTLGFASTRATYGATKYELTDTYAIQLGLGWNLSSYVRTELDFQNITFGFSDLDDARAYARSAGATLYFDLLRRWVRTGDITRQRRLVPFIGFGVGAGTYEFQGPGGNDGLMITPRAVAGLNVMITDLIGVDLAWQYQMHIVDGFGWTSDNTRIANMNNIMLTMRANF
ncbi:hypothetical protein HDR63_03675 [bacterium]|nr:hypothetical protein [bacterium]